MATESESMISPGIEGLLERSAEDGKEGSKFRLVTLGAKRARQINAYRNHLGDGPGASVPPQVTSISSKPLTIAFEEIIEGKVIAGEMKEETQTNFQEKEIEPTEAD
ncbi:MAG: DNA-directed RNA polymerase subunit omega [Acidimicrobiales bacterium]|nr:DNA-directed RNA polymerase subunit omega [Acidimicrobiales bacterium]MDG1844780.1 DNA-directed RNA polymerase subunit omega [Acidimicrobiales bacterium]